MGKMKKIKRVLDELINLQRSYALTFRAPTTEERHKNLIDSGLISKYDYGCNFLREPLIEHVGHLPIIASFLHEKLEHRDKIDLGRVLTILSVHDIGETQVGDVLTYKKNKIHEKAELEATMKILPSYLFKYFKEFEDRKSLDAKFAKAVDALAPLLHELTIPEVTIGRFKYSDFDTDKIVEKKKQYFEFDNFLKELFEYTITLFREMESNSRKSKA